MRLTRGSLPVRGVCPRRAFATYCVAAAFGLPGCTTEADHDHAAEVRDSAGIRIVTNTSPALPPERMWRLEEQPAVEFGPDHSLHRIGSIARLPDGRIVVAHTGGSEVLVFDTAGELLTRFGRAGSGPGEFRELSRLAVIAGGDSLLIFDAGQLRASIFDTEGRFARSHVPPTLGSELPGMVAGEFGDGSLLLVALTPPSPENRGLVRPSRALWRSAPDGSTTTPIVELPGQETFYQESPWGPPDMRRPYFGRTSVYAAGRDRLYAAATEDYEVRVHALDGTLLSLIRKRHSPVAVTANAKALLIDRQLASVTDDNSRREARRMLENLAEPATAPALGWPTWATRYGPDLLVDEGGNLWVVEFFMPGAESNARAVFDTAGEWLGTVTLPDRFAPTHIGDDFVLGRWRDSLDVEHVRLYELIK